jgi:putative hydrolase of the HAD superfamily
MPKLKAIVFDLDDTLYLERDFVLSGFQAVADWGAVNLGISQELGYSTLFNLYHQGIRNNTFNQWLEIHDVQPAAIVPKLLDVYRQHRPRISPFPESLSLLKTIANSYQIGLVSDGYLAVQQQKWAALGLDSFFDAVVFSDSLGRANWKPSTAPFESVLAQLETMPAESVYIGDNPLKDFLGARQLGMYTIQVNHPDSEYGKLQPPSLDHFAHFRISSLTEVLSTIDQINLLLEIC